MQENKFAHLTHINLDESYGVYLEPHEITHFAVGIIHFGGDPALEPLVAMLHLRIKQATNNTFDVAFYWEVKAQSGNPFTEQHSAIAFSIDFSEAIETFKKTDYEFSLSDSYTPLESMKDAFEYLCWYREYNGFWTR